MRSVISILVICAMAAAPAFAVGGGANWNTGFQPTFNTQEYGNQGPTGFDSSRNRPTTPPACREPSRRNAQQRQGASTDRLKGTC